jgi:short-subunit dehydrogenase
VVAFTKIMMFTYKYFEKKGEGHIVGISSIAGIRGLDVCPSYSASKGYEALYLESLRRKARKSGLNIKILTVLPGFVDTAMGQGNHVFWRASVKKAVSQIKTAIYKGYGRAYITRRWRVIAWILKFVPRWIFERA